MPHKILGIFVPRDFTDSVPIISCSSQGFYGSDPKFMELNKLKLRGFFNLIWWLVHFGFSTA